MEPSEFQKQVEAMNIDQFINETNIRQIVINGLCEKSKTASDSRVNKLIHLYYDRRVDFGTWRSQRHVAAVANEAINPAVFPSTALGPRQFVAPRPELQLVLGERYRQQIEAEERRRAQNVDDLRQEPQPQGDGGDDDGGENDDIGGDDGVEPTPITATTTAVKGMTAS